MKCKFVTKNKLTGEEIVFLGDTSSTNTWMLLSKLGEMGFRFLKQKRVAKRRTSK